MSLRVSRNMTQSHEPRIGGCAQKRIGQREAGRLLLFPCVSETGSDGRTYSAIALWAVLT